MGTLLTGFSVYLNYTAPIDYDALPEREVVRKANRPICWFDWQSLIHASWPLYWILTCPFLAIILLLTFATPSLAEKAHYVSDYNLAEEILPPPPEIGSAEQRAELGEVIALSKARNENEAALALSERTFFIFSFTSAIGPWFQTNKFPLTEAFFRRVQQDTDRTADVGKAIWKRPRPYEVETNLFSGYAEKPLTSYPSGHSTRATVFALLLADLFPDRRDAILAVGRQIGWNRVIIGMHYPSDVYAGRVLGKAIVRQMNTNPDFQRDFKQVKTEIASALKGQH